MEKRRRVGVVESATKAFAVSGTDRQTVRVTTIL